MLNLLVQLPLTNPTLCLLDDGGKQLEDEDGGSLVDMK
jgi:hypothetical protein